MPILARPEPVSRASIITAAILAVSVLVAGCSAIRLGYGQAPPIAFRWLDKYVDFNDAQELAVKAGLRDWFAWHRKTQLPDYAALLAKARSEVLTNTTPERACTWWSDVKTRAVPALDRALPVMAEVVASLTPAQLARIESRYAKNNDEYRDEYLQPDAKERRENNLERAIDRAETVYGGLDDAQREIVRRTVAESPFDAEVWFVERQRRQQDAMQTMRHIVATKPTKADAQMQIRGYFERIEASPREPYRRYAEKLERFNCSAAATLHNGTTMPQRQTAARRLKGWEEDFMALAADPG